jgi:hypothetical protein
VRDRNLLLGIRWGVDRYDPQRLCGGCTSGLRGFEVSKKYDYKDQELDLKMRIKFLEKKLREPDHGVEQYEEWQSNLEMVTNELTKLQVRKFKFFLGKWVHNFKEQNQLINVVDCMFVALEKEDQKDVAMKWYMRVTDPKETRCLEKLLEYKTAEVNMWKANMKAMKKQQGQGRMNLRNQYKKAKEDIKKRYERQLFIKCQEIRDLQEQNLKLQEVV